MRFLCRGFPGRSFSLLIRAINRTSLRTSTLRVRKRLLTAACVPSLAWLRARRLSSRHERTSRPLQHPRPYCCARTWTTSRSSSLNRPQARNSLSEALIAALTESLAEIATDKRVRVVVLAANGPAFSRRPRHEGDDRAAPRCRSRARLFQAADGRLRRHDAGDRASAEAGDRLPCRVPRARPAASWSQAAISRSRRARRKFATPGVNIGLFCSTPMVALSRNVSRKPRWRCCSPAT